MSAFTPDEALNGTPRRMDRGMPAAVDLREQLLSRQLSATELAQDVAQRVDSRNAETNALLSWDEDMLMSQAAQADDALAAFYTDSGSVGNGQQAPSAAEGGVTVPPLTGLPMGMKDALDVAGLVTTFGSGAVDHARAEQDDPHTARVRAAGANIFAKTSVPEFLLSCHAENEIHPPARNPLDLDRSPGGSSGGAAAAVADGLLPVAPGNDGGGSVRIPASATGLVGLKLGLGTMVEDITDVEGRVSPVDEWGAPKLGCSGPLGRSAQDAALLFDGMMFNPQSPGATPALEAVVNALNEDADLSGLHVGYTTASAFDSALAVEISPAAKIAFDRARATLASLNTTIEESPWDPPEDYDETFRAVWTAGLGRAPIQHEDQLGPLAASFRAEALARSAEDQARANQRLLDISGSLSTAWGAFDVMLTPAMAETPRPIGYFTQHDGFTDYRLQCLYTPYTSMVNVAGLPAITVPVGWTSDGFSMSAQLIGRQGSETQLLVIAALMQRELSVDRLI